MTPRRSLLLVSAAAALLLAAGCGRTQSARGGPPAVPVQTATAVQRDMPRRIEAIGKVQALRTVNVKSQVDGIIAAVHFKEGDDVQAGELLVTLDRRPFENAVLQARAALATAQAQARQAAVDADRYSHLDQQSAISKESLAQYETRAETTKADVQSRAAALANAELQLGYTEIRAPIAGRTGQLLLHEGALMKANDNNFTVVTINQLTPISVAYSVPEDSLPALRATMAAGAIEVLVTDNTTGVSRGDGRLTFIDNAVDPTTGTIVLKALFENADHALWPGQFVRVQTQTGVDRAAIVVPSAAVQTGQDNAQVYVVKPDHTVELRVVNVLRTVDDLTLLAGGVKAGETVVTDGQLRLVPGARVEAKALAAATVTAGAGGNAAP
ncbi:MAG TPA: efflux RND transporter periplasmic adaptor subunit [Lacunisphaera sp.]|nr:efflux RND transporter periplasmic adaptor subunit [Lacunisphaera sp.]